MESTAYLRRAMSLALPAALLLTGSSCGQSYDGSYRGEAGTFEVVTVVDGLSHPWSMAFLPSGDMLVTERPGRLRLVRDGVLLPDPVPGVPEVRERGQGGLLDVVLHPEFGSNRWVYLTYSIPGEGSRDASTALARGRFENDRLNDVEVLFVAEAFSSAGQHFGSRLAFDSAGYLFMTVGDRGAPPVPASAESHASQDLSNHQGTVLRLLDDGTVPADNPFVGQEGALPEIWSYGHRNPQGLALHPTSGDLWSNEHGPQGGDELNRVLPGRNYGWPVIGYGVQYGGSAIHASTSRAGMEQPIHYWVPSIATSGLLIYSGDAFPDWRGSVFVGGLAGTQLARLTFTGTEISEEETLLDGMGRIRDIRQGPDGMIYLAIDEGNAPILRLEPR